MLAGLPEASGFVQPDGRVVTSRHPEIDSRRVALARPTHDRLHQLGGDPRSALRGDTHIETSSIDDPAGSGRYPPTIPTTDWSTMAR